MVALFQQMLGNAGMLNTFLVQNDLPIIQIIGVPELFKALHHHPGDLEGRRLGHDHLPGRDLPDRPGAVRGRRGRRCQRPGSGCVHITLPALKGLFILLLILRLGNSLSVGFEQIILQQGPVGLRGQRGARHLGLQQRHPRRELGHSPRPGWSRASSASVLVIGANKLAHLFGERGVYEK